MLSRTRQINSQVITPIANKSIYHVHINSDYGDVYMPESNKPNTNLFTHNYLCVKNIDNERKQLRRQLNNLDREIIDHLSSLDKDMKAIKEMQRRILSGSKKVPKNAESSDSLPLMSRSARMPKNFSPRRENTIVSSIENKTPLQKEKSMISQSDINKSIENNEMSEEELTNQNRCKSSVYMDVYEIKRLPENTSSLSTNSNQNGFSKSHLFDVFLDHEAPPMRKNRLPSLVNIYENTHRLSMIDKFNPTTVRSFRKLLNESKKRGKTSHYDFESSLSSFDGRKLKRTTSISSILSTSSSTSSTSNFNFEKKFRN